MKRIIKNKQFVFTTSKIEHEPRISTIATSEDNNCNNWIDYNQSYFKVPITITGGTLKKREQAQKLIKESIFDKQIKRNVLKKVMNGQYTQCNLY